MAYSEALEVLKSVYKEQVGLGVNLPPLEFSFMLEGSESLSDGRGYSFFIVIEYAQKPFQLLARFPVVSIPRLNKQQSLHRSHLRMG